MAAGSGVALPDAAAAALAETDRRVGGGLQLAGLSLRGQQDVAGFVAAFTGSHRYVLDYLAGEVLERQSAQVRTFLLETSVLDRLSGPLCDAVTGRTGSQALLEQVEQGGPVPDAAGLGARLVALPPSVRRPAPRPPAGRTQPGRVAQLHRNAAAVVPGARAGR